MKRGDVRAPLLEAQAYLGDAATLPGYRLFNTGDYPALIKASTIGVPGLAVRGELWRVDAACLERIDEEEGVDEGLYQRDKIELSNGQTAWTYLYLHSIDGMDDCGDCWSGGC